ncbi:MAG: SDR family NAD(P)-dependent oxidoreductase [Alphaproteobacteria bacterium]
MTGGEKPAGVVITGAAGHLGAALARSFAADGHAVFAADIAAAQPAAGVTPVVADVTDRSSVLALAEKASAESRLQVWINAAGIFPTGPVRQASVEIWDRTIAINLTGTFNGCAVALEAMIAGGGGRIVNISSVSGLVGGIAVHPAYGASKAGILALTKTYALEGARHGVACNAVAPGMFDSAMSRNFSDEQRIKLARAIPAGRLGQVAEIVPAVRFLADPVAAAYVTGETLSVNGGAYMR